MGNTATMASGYGLAGGPSRCFPFWQEVLACYTTNTNAEDDSGKAKCAPVLEDYYECLHHKKEAARTLALQAAYRKAEANIKRDDAPSPARYGDWACWTPRWRRRTSSRPSGSRTRRSTRQTMRGRGGRELLCIPNQTNLKCR